MKKSLLWMLAIVVITWGCEQGVLVPQKNQINLSELKAGTVTYYLRYQTTCGDMQDSFFYTGDTLKVEIVENGASLYFKESFTEGSPSFNPQLQPFEHEVIPSSKGDYFRIPARAFSQLFFFYGNDTIHVKPQERVKLSQESCQLILDEDAFVGNDIGKINKLEIGDITLKNKTAVSCVPGSLFFPFGENAFLIYDQKSLYMSHTGPFPDGNIQGWVRIP